MKRKRSVDINIAGNKNYFLIVIMEKIVLPTESKLLFLHLHAT